MDITIDNTDVEVTPMVLEEPQDESKQTDKGEPQKPHFKIEFSKLFPDAGKIVSKLPFSYIAALRNKKKWLLTEEEADYLGRYANVVLDKYLGDILPAWLEQFKEEAALVIGMLSIGMAKFMNKDDTVLDEKKAKQSVEIGVHEPVIVNENTSREAEGIYLEAGGTRTVKETKLGGGEYTENSNPDVERASDKQTRIPARKSRGVKKRQDRNSKTGN